MVGHGHVQAFDPDLGGVQAGYADTCQQQTRERKKPLEAEPAWPLLPRVWTVASLPFAPCPGLAAGGPGPLGDVACSGDDLVETEVLTGLDAASRWSTRALAALGLPAGHVHEVVLGSSPDAPRRYVEVTGDLLSQNREAHA